MKNEKAENTLAQCMSRVSVMQSTYRDVVVETTIHQHLQARWLDGKGPKPCPLGSNGYWPEGAFRALCALFDNVPHVLLDERVSAGGGKKCSKDYLLGTREEPEGYVSLRVDSDDEHYLTGVISDGVLSDRVDALCCEYYEYERKTTDKEEEQHAFMLVSTPHGLTARSIGLAAVPLVRENYSSAARTAFETLRAELHSETPTGRLALITGASGTGKSYLIRGLMHELPAVRFLFVPTDIVASLGQPELISVLFDLRDNDGEKRTVIVAEDADAILVTREIGSSVALSTMLNLTSGVLGELLDVRIIATTNAERFEVDVALRRPGRMIDLGVTGGLEISPLSTDQARAALVNLLKADPEAPLKASNYITESMTIAAVYMQARRLGWKG